MGGQPNTFIVSAKSEYRSMADVIAAAKAGRGIDFVSPGVGTLGHLLMESLAAQAGVKLQHIPHRGASQAVLDLVAGTVPLGTMTWGSAIGQIRAGTVRPVAMSSASRVPRNFPTCRRCANSATTSSPIRGSDCRGRRDCRPDIVVRLNARRDRHSGAAGGARALCGATPSPRCR